MSSLINMDFVQALNPLYAFPIVAVILCALIVYAFGFKSPVQPPSFDGIEEEKKSSKKKKTKDTSKGKLVQNDKQNGSTSNKVQTISSSKKTHVEKSVSDDKPVVEKVTEKKEKVTKKAKQSNEKRNTQEKKKVVVSHIHEDAAEDGWTQLISRKGRKNRKKDEIATTESQTVIKNSHVDKFGDNTPSEEFPVKSDILEKTVTEKKNEINKDYEDIKVSNVENNKDKVIVIETDTLQYSLEEKVPVEDNFKNEKVVEETSNKSKKKKKKNAEVTNTNNDFIINPEPPAVQIIPEDPLPRNATNNQNINETPEIITGKIEENEPKELKSSNVVFDELEGLYAKENGAYNREMKKKKKVRRDH